MHRAVWKGAISFGLVHVPVSLYPASGEGGIEFDWLEVKPVRAELVEACPELVEGPCALVRSASPSTSSGERTSLDGSGLRPLASGRLRFRQPLARGGGTKTRCAASLGRIA